MSSGFISEAEIEERKKTRQEEWDRVRKADDPKEAPEEPYDPRSLYEKLHEQKVKKDMEYEEAHKLKNMIKGLDDDEVAFLDSIDRSKLQAERRQQQEESKEIKEFRDAVATLHEKSLQEKFNVKSSTSTASAAASTSTSSSSSSKTSQQKLLLSGAVKRKSSTSESSQGETTKTTKLSDSNDPSSNSEAGTKRKHEDEKEEASVQSSGSTLQCIGILPGIGNYYDSSDSEYSSNTDEELAQDTSSYDLCGRKLVKVPIIRKEN